MIGFIKKHFGSLFRFALIGGLGAGINLSVQYVFTECLGLWYIFSAIVGFFFSLVNNYFLNYYFNFKRAKEG